MATEDRDPPPPAPEERPEGGTRTGNVQIYDRPMLADLARWAPGVTAGVLLLAALLSAAFFLGWLPLGLVLLAAGGL